MTITTNTTGLARALAVGAALATLSVGAIAASVPAASAHAGSVSLRSHGDDDPGQPLADLGGVGAHGHSFVVDAVSAGRSGTPGVGEGV